MIYTTNHTFYHSQSCKLSTRHRVVASLCIEKSSINLRVLFRLPFNWRTPVGYMVALLGQWAAAVCTLFGGTTAISFLVGSCWLFITILDDITNDLNKLNGRNRKKLQHFREIIVCYADVKQLSHLNHDISNSIYSNGFYSIGS